MDLSEYLKLGLKDLHKGKMANRVILNKEHRQTRRDKIMSVKRQITGSPLAGGPNDKTPSPPKPESPSRKELLIKWKQERDKRKLAERAKQKPVFKVFHIDKSTNTKLPELPPVSKKGQTPNMYKFAGSTHKFKVPSNVKQINFKYNKDSSKPLRDVQLGTGNEPIVRVTRSQQVPARKKLNMEDILPSKNLHPDLVATSKNDKGTINKPSVQASKQTTSKPKLARDNSNPSISKPKLARGNSNPSISKPKLARGNSNPSIPKPKMARGTPNSVTEVPVATRTSSTKSVDNLKTEHSSKAGNAVTSSKPLSNVNTEQSSKAENAASTSKALNNLKTGRPSKVTQIVINKKPLNTEKSASSRITRSNSNSNLGTKSMNVEKPKPNSGAKSGSAKSNTGTNGSDDPIDSLVESKRSGDQLNTDKSEKIAARADRNHVRTRAMSSDLLHTHKECNACGDQLNADRSEAAPKTKKMGTRTVKNHTRAMAKEVTRKNDNHDESPQNLEIDTGGEIEQASLLLVNEKETQAQYSTEQLYIKQEETVGVSEESKKPVKVRRTRATSKAKQEGSAKSPMKQSEICVKDEADVANSSINIKVEVSSPPKSRNKGRQSGLHRKSMEFINEEVEISSPPKFQKKDRQSALLRKSMEFIKPQPSIPMKTQKDGRQAIILSTIGERTESEESSNNKSKSQGKTPRKSLRVRTAEIAEVVEEKNVNTNTPLKTPKSIRKSQSGKKGSNMLMLSNKSECSFKSMSTDYPISDDSVFESSLSEFTTAANTPDDKQDPVVYVSPFVTMSRGKNRARKEYHERHSKGGLCEASPEVTGSKAGAAYFYKVLDDEISRIETECEDWTTYRDENELPEEACDLINTAIGQSRLLISKRMNQFRGLINSCAGQDTDPLITCGDLHGFWDTLLIQVRNLDSRFENLVKWRSNNWKEVLPEIKAPLIVRPNIRKPPGRKVKSSSSIRDAIKAAKKKNQAALLDTQNVFDGGFFTVKSPSKTCGVDTSKTQVKGRSSLLKVVLKADFDKRASPGLAMYRVTQKSRSIGTLGTEMNIIGGSVTPGKSILKQTRESKSSVKKAVLFHDDVAEELKPDNNDNPFISDENDLNSSNVQPDIEDGPAKRSSRLSRNRLF